MRNRKSLEKKYVPLFNRGQDDNESDLVEIIQMPTVNEVTASQSEGSKKKLIYLSREEAEKMFA